jgi:CRP/FNR family transcriptional regulator
MSANTPFAAGPSLAAFPALSAITDPAWLEALQAARERVIPANTVVMRAGDSCTNFFLVLRGRVRVYRVDESGREIVLYRVGAGDICVMTLGNLAGGLDYAAETMTEEEVSVLAIPRSCFQRALAESEAFRNLILSELARRLIEVMRLVEQVAFQKLDLRLACLLGRLSGQRNTPCLNVTHQEIARELGTTREVTSRLLKEFEHRGCIRLQRGRIEILSPETLARLKRD